jgi:hypothetical protein
MLDVNRPTMALPGAPAAPRLCESSACLLMALQQGRSGLRFSVDTISGAAMADGNYLLLNGSTVQMKHLVDMWGGPLEFFRFPTDFTDLNPNTVKTHTFGDPQRGMNDALDRNGLLNDYTWLTSTNPANGQIYALVFHKLGTPTVKNQPAPSYKIQPVIVARGSNGYLGINNNNDRMIAVPPAYPLADPMTVDQSALSPANDNLYSNRLRFGARGDSK